MVWWMRDEIIVMVWYENDDDGDDGWRWRMRVWYVMRWDEMIDMVEGCKVMMKEGW